MSAPGKALPKPGSLGAWALAIRPKTLSASVMPVIVGSAYAWEFYDHSCRQGFLMYIGPPFALIPRVVAALVVGVGIQIGTNLVNDVADHLKGADTPERLGPPRVTNLGLLSPSAVIRGAVVSFGLAAAAGIWLLLSLQGSLRVSVWPAAVLGLVALGCGVLYTVGPVSIAYLGLGEIFVFGFFGLFATAGTTFVMTGRWVDRSVIAGVALGLLAMGLLEANNIRDIPTDGPVGKRTLAVRFGDGPARKMYVGIIVASIVCAMPLVPWWGAAVLLVCGPVAWLTVRPVLDGASGRDLIKVLQRNSLLEVLVGATLAASSFLASCAPRGQWIR